MPRPPNTGYLCYMLYSMEHGKIYVGSTNNMQRRLRQHNKTNQGAKYTKKYRPWIVAATVRGFSCHKDALSFEWAWQHPQRTRHLKNYRLEGLISKCANRCFSNWYKAVYYMCDESYWYQRSIHMECVYAPPLLANRLPEI